MRSPFALLHYGLASGLTLEALSGGHEFRISYCGLILPSPYLFTLASLEEDIFRRLICLNILLLPRSQGFYRSICRKEPSGVSS